LGCRRVGSWGRHTNLVRVGPSWGTPGRPASTPVAVGVMKGRVEMGNTVLVRASSVRGACWGWEELSGVCAQGMD